MIQNHPAYTSLVHNKEFKTDVVEEFGTFEQSKKVMERGLMLGVSQVLDETHMYKICESLERFKR
jgi:dTDP-4-amino-4,6-dideoxygalactose transaminase